jgi:hypothetical protein
MGQRNERYFTTNVPRYVGQFIRIERYGYGDSGLVFGIFDDNGKQVKVEYTYEGTTNHMISIAFYWFNRLLFKRFTHLQSF